MAVRPWPGTRPGTAPSAGLLASLTFSGAHDEADSLPEDTVVGRWLSEIRAMGYAGVRTGAVGPGIAGRLAVHGFATVQELELLSADLTSVPPAPSLPLRTLRHRVVTPRLARDVLAVDRRSFPTGWHMDSLMFRDARRATSHSALHTARISTGPDTDTGTDTVGFVLAGRTARTGYVQRLAVDPGHRRRGVAFALLAAAHSWLRAAACATALVNTEPTNLPALALYRRFGYATLPYRLQVLECDLSAVEAA